MIAQLLDQDEPYSSFYWNYVSRPTLIHLNIDQINKTMLNKIKKSGVPTFAYTVNSLDQFKKAKSLKLNGIFTDNAQLFNEMKVF